MATPESKKYFGACPHDCPDTCAMIFEVDDGRLIGVQGNRDHPMTRGGLCVKLALPRATYPDLQLRL